MSTTTPILNQSQQQATNTATSTTTVTATQILQNNASRVNKKPNSIFIVPQQIHSTNVQTATPTPTTTPVAATRTTQQPQHSVTNKNKISVIPINLASSQFKIINKSQASTAAANTNNATAIGTVTGITPTTKKMIINTTTGGATILNGNSMGNPILTTMQTGTSGTTGQTISQQPQVTIIGGGTKGHIVKVINTPSSSNQSNIKITTTLPTVQSTALLPTSSSGGVTSASLTSLLNQYSAINQENSPLKLHTYQINKSTTTGLLTATPPTATGTTMPLITKSLYIPQNQLGQAPTVIHKITSTGTGATATATGHTNPVLASVTPNTSHHSVLKIPTKINHIQYNSSSNSNKTSFLSSSSSSSGTSGGTTTVSDDYFSNNTTYTNENMIDTGLDVDAMKLMYAYNSLQTQNTDQQAQQQLIPNTSKLKPANDSVTPITPTNTTAATATTTQAPAPVTANSANSNSTSGNSNSNIRKPCNCTKSQCLKLYCDCFAMGSFCYNCNCTNCSNTLEHEDERNQAIKLVLDRNPNAFQSKIGKFTYTPAAAKSPTQIANEPSSDPIDDIQNRHIKGCNCKKSNCLKRYCECYLAKIQCSSLCKCIGCKNCDDNNRKNLLQLANAAEFRKQQMISYLRNRFDTQHSSHNNPNQKLLNKLDPNNSFSYDLINKNSKYESDYENAKLHAFINNEVAEATCHGLIAEALDCEQQSMNETEIERYVLEEFGRILIDIIESAENNNICFNNSS